MTDFSWPRVLGTLVAGNDISADAARWAMRQILQGDASAAQIAGFAVALRAKGETIDELGALANSMLDFATPLEITREAVDVVGTGGDQANTVNVSTMAAIVAAGAGVPVVKHGNRAASSACGTADCLEALGVNLELASASQAKVLAEVGVVFLYAPMYHPSLRFAGPPRRELGIPTTFNFLGPLANPARPLAQAVGCADLRMAPLMAGVFAARGARGLVFHGDDGLDELTTTGPSRIWLISDGEVKETRFDPTSLGIVAPNLSDLVGGAPDANAEIARRVLAGESGPVRDIVALNAAAAILAFRGPKLSEPLTQQLADCYDDAVSAIVTGAAATVLDRWIAVTN